MKIAILQFNPQLGAVEANMQRAQALLDAHPVDIDLLVLPELAFSGYNFPSLDAIRPFLEPTASGTTTQWAIHTAKQRACTVIVGYPEIATETRTADGSHTKHTHNYNSTVTVSPQGIVLANYRKSFLYYTDETWAEEGWHTTSDQRPFFVGPLGPLGLVGHGICMDLNPYRFDPNAWTQYEFARAMLARDVPLVVLSMAWLTRLTLDETALHPERPDMETLAYWRERLWPFVDAAPPHPIVVVLANRCGSEGAVERVVLDDNGERVPMGDCVAYAGSSCVMGFQAGTVKLWEQCSGPNRGEVGLLGKGEEALLVVDTSEQAHFLLQQKTN